MDIKIEGFSDIFVVRELTKDDVEDLYHLCKANTLYYEYHPPCITREGIVEDMHAHPPDKSEEDKYYVGFYDDEIIAILDFIVGYPNKTCGYIGFFMMNKELQGKQIGSTIIDGVKSYAQVIGLQELQLAYMKENLQSEHFWFKQKFRKIGEKEIHEGIAVTMQYTL